MVNSPENAKLSFEGITSEIMQSLMETNFSFYKQFANDDEFKNALLGFLFQRFTERLNNPDEKEKA